MLTRTAMVIVLIVGTGLYARGAAPPNAAPARTSFHELPLVIAGAEGYEARPFADDVIEKVGADDYVNRVYIDDGVPIALYAGYYAGQRQGDAIHSPQNCLPGAGWRPVTTDRVDIGDGVERHTVNRVLITKGRERQAVFYWYQGRGRVVANEFANKAWLMLDAARSGRTDGGLVRLITPVRSSPEDAYARLDKFAAALMPLLREHLP